MYSNKLAVAIKANGKTLREFEDNVYLPFNSEYSIFIKNKNSVRASVKIEIDGVDVTQGVSIVVNPNDSFELERFIKNGNLVAGNRFKFIRRTSRIENNRGIKVEDGLVRVEFQFEKIQQNYTYSSYPIVTYPIWFQSTQVFPSVNNQHVFTNVNNLTSNANINASSGIRKYDKCDGFTAAGSISHQEFNQVTNFQLENQKHVIILKLLGEHEGQTVSKIVATRSRTTCITCGTISKSTSARFCSHCGTSLQIIN